MRRALGEAAFAAALVVAVLVVGANFVLVEVRLLGAVVEMRLGWALVVAAAFGFALGMAWARRPGRRR